MIADVTMAFVVAIAIELFSLCGYFKQFIIFACCLPVVLVYFINGYQINFIGQMDFAIWIMFVLMFDVVLTLITKEIKKHIE